MDIPGLSMSMSTSKLQTAWGMKMLENSMDIVKEQGAAFEEMIESAPAPAVPGVGGNVDLSV